MTAEELNARTRASRASGSAGEGRAGVRVRLVLQTRVHLSHLDRVAVAHCTEHRGPMAGAALIGLRRRNRIREKDKRVIPAGRRGGREEGQSGENTTIALVESGTR